jgi:predicted DNA-binding protein
MVKSVSIKLGKEEAELLEKLKQARRTKNNAQIFREAIYCLGEKILPSFVPIGTKD